MIHGTVDPGFAAVRAAFESSFADGLEHGGAMAAFVDGRLVANLWGGHADAARTRPWGPDTLVNVWSVTKGVLAAAVAMAVERGVLTYDRPIAEVWPAFAANGKERIPLDLVVSHRAGLNGLSVPMDEAGLLRWTPYVDALAAMTPLYPPGSVMAYHALTYGHLAGEALRRASGKSVGRFLAEEICQPLSAAFYVGLPESEEALVAEMTVGAKASDWLDDVLASPYPQSASNPSPRALAPNERAWRAAEVPGGNGHGTALGLASIYSAMVDGQQRLMRTAAVKEAIRPRFTGTDLSFNVPTSYGAGFRLADHEYGPKASPQAFGHGGWGGAIAFADPDARLAFAYVTNRMLGFDDGDPRRHRLVTAVYDAL
jgi:CubicO group peptidase (beta-lactamase class C family)